MNVRFTQEQVVAALALMLVAVPTLRLAARGMPRSAATGAQSAQTAGRKPAKPKVAARANEQPMPFRAGETLTYRVSWAAFSNAATLQLAVPERRDLFGWTTWHFRAAAHTVNPVRMLFSVDDQFDSYTDVATLESRQFELHLDELGRKQDQVLHFVTTDQPFRAPGPSVVVLPGSRDPLGTLYALRAVDWQRTPELRAPVYDGRNLYEMRAGRQTAGEVVTVAAGRFTTSRVVVRVFQYEKEVAGIRFVLWLANDAPRKPVVMQAELPFGNLHAELVSASN